MLVLSRRRDESIVIGDNIIITVVDIRGDKVRLGIDCPSEIPVHRTEVYEAIQRENMNAMRYSHEQFREHLTRGDYTKAFNMVLDNNSLGSRVEIDEMVYGLNQMEK